MSWFKVDDLWHGHPKSRRAGLEAVGLWSLGGSHAMAYKTDGFVPDWYIRTWGAKGTRAAACLVTAGLWEAGERDGDTGYWFHDWADYQPSADDIERSRELSRDRQRRHRQKRGKAPDEGVPDEPLF